MVSLLSYIQVLHLQYLVILVKIVVVLRELIVALMLILLLVLLLLLRMTGGFVNSCQFLGEDGHVVTRWGRQLEVLRFAGTVLCCSLF